MARIDELASQYGLAPIDNDLGHYASDPTEHGYKNRDDAANTNDQYSKDHTEDDTPEYNASRQEKKLNLRLIKNLLE